jgi:hypothetical protein
VSSPLTRHSPPQAQLVAQIPQSPQVWPIPFTIQPAVQGTPQAQKVAHCGQAAHCVVTPLQVTDPLTPFAQSLSIP